MRATINFEVDADKVEETMATLVSQEAATLRIAANILDNLGGGPLLQEVNETIYLLQEAAIQLKQYRDMLAGFERARFETMLPQKVGVSENVFNNIEELRGSLNNVADFSNFLQGTQEEEELEDEPQEG